MLVRYNRPPESWSRRLTAVFGTADWQEEFYRTEESRLIEGMEFTTKVANLEKIEHFFLERMRLVFPAVAEPLLLRNSIGSPLYLFCFAAGNKRGAPVALKIAQDIIGG
jgi:hypothetical protein